MGDTPRTVAIESARGQGGPGGAHVAFHHVCACAQRGGTITDERGPVHRCKHLRLQCGEILEPSIPCDCYYQPVCPQNCMQYIEVPRVLAACLKHLGAPVR